MVQKRGPRRAFTLVELLVVIAIIGILVALLLPAVQAAREAARRMACGNNLKQVSLALHNYHDTYKTFPPEAIWVDRFVGQSTATAGQQRNYTWIALTLPYIEQAPLYEAINFRLPFWPQTDASGRPYRSTLIPSVQCPSDPSFGTTDKTHTMSWTSYAGNEGYDWWGREGDWYAGPFTFRGHGTRIANIIDGTSNTIAIGEVGTRSVYDCRGLGWMANRVGGSGCARRETDAVFRSALIATQPHPTVAQDSRMGGGARVWGGNGNILWPDSGSPVTNWWNSNAWALPYAYKPIYMSHRAINSAHWSSAHSQHPGGAQFGLCDGSVRFISQTISTGGNGGPAWDPEGEFGNVWFAIHTIQGHTRETTPSFD